MTALASNPAIVAVVEQLLVSYTARSMFDVPFDEFVTFVRNTATLVGDSAVAAETVSLANDQVIIDGVTRSLAVTTALTNAIAKESDMWMSRRVVGYVRKRSQRISLTRACLASPRVHHQRGVARVSHLRAKRAHLVYSACQPERMHHQRRVTRTCSRSSCSLHARASKSPYQNTPIKTRCPLLAPTS